MYDYYIMRRVSSADRMDGISDLLARAVNASVLDIGCNKGMVGYEFACHGAKVVHGCDNYEKGINVAREVFADFYGVQSKFVVLNLANGYKDLVAAFENSPASYDVILLLAVVHKLRRVCQPNVLVELLTWLGERAKFIGWRGYEDELQMLDDAFGKGMKRVQYSHLSGQKNPAAIWAKDG